MSEDTMHRHTQIQSHTLLQKKLLYHSCILISISLQIMVSLGTADCFLSCEGQQLYANENILRCSAVAESALRVRNAASQHLSR